jgi:hypothetical protein
MKLSIIIVNYNTKEYLRSTLSAIYKFPPKFDFEVIVIDNASKDGSYKMLRDKFPQVRVIKNRVNVGFARANNQGISRAKGEYILFLNPDATPTSGAIEAIVKFMEGKTSVGCVGGRLLYPDGSLQLSCRSFPTYISVFFGRASLFRKIFPANRFSRAFLLTDLDYNKIQKVDWVIGACMLTRKELLIQMNCFDERFFLFVEDMDFCYRLKKRGLSTYYFPGAVFKHHHGVSTQRYWISATIHHNFGMYRFFSKYYSNFNLFLKGGAGIFLLFRVIFLIFVISIIKSQDTK